MAKLFENIPVKPNGFYGTFPLVRTHLEFSSTVWNQYLKSDILKSNKNTDINMWRKGLKGYGFEETIIDTKERRPKTDIHGSF